MYIVAVDPGTSGSISLISCAPGVIILESWRSIKHQSDWREQIYLLCKFFQAQAVIEAVHSFPGMGVVGAFTFGDNFGCARTAMNLAGCVERRVEPKLWQRRMGLPHHSDIPTKSKRRTAHRKSQKELALKLFPELKEQIEKFKKERGIKKTADIDVYASVLIGYAAALDELQIPLGRINP